VLFEPFNMAQKELREWIGYASIHFLFKLGIRVIYFQEVF